MAPGQKIQITQPLLTPTNWHPLLLDQTQHNYRHSTNRHLLTANPSLHSYRHSMYRWRYMERRKYLYCQTQDRRSAYLLARLISRRDSLPVLLRKWDQERDDNINQSSKQSCKLENNHKKKTFHWYSNTRYAWNDPPVLYEVQKAGLRNLDQR